MEYHSCMYVPRGTYHHQMGLKRQRLKHITVIVLLNTKILTCNKTVRIVFPLKQGFLTWGASTPEGC